jgi:hypothetical protein
MGLVPKHELTQGYPSFLNAQSLSLGSDVRLLKTCFLAYPARMGEPS